MLLILRGISACLKTLEERNPSPDQIGNDCLMVRKYLVQSLEMMKL